MICVVTSASVVVACVDVGKIVVVAAVVVVVVVFVLAEGEKLACGLSLSTSHAMTT